MSWEGARGIASLFLRRSDFGGLTLCCRIARRHVSSRNTHLDANFVAIPLCRPYSNNSIVPPRRLHGYNYRCCFCGWQYNPYCRSDSMSRPFSRRAWHRGKTSIPLIDILSLSGGCHGRRWGHFLGPQPLL